VNDDFHMCLILHKCSAIAFVIYLRGARENHTSNVMNHLVRDTINEVSLIVVYVMDLARDADCIHISVSGNTGSIVNHL
jgi:hypothetical protein